MKLKTMATVMLATALAACTQPKSERTDQSAELDYIGRHKITVKDGRMTPEVLWAFGRLADIQVSPG